MFSRILKVTIFFTIISLGLSFSARSANALTIIKRSQMGIEDSSIKQDDNFLQPDSIVVTPIFIEGDDFVSDYDWYQGLYYYQAVRLNQGDFLFHYLVSKSGQIFDGAIKGEEHRFPLDKESVHPIIIAYMAGKNDVEVDDVAKNNLAELILDIANRNSIPLDNVYARGIQFVAKPNSSVTTRLNLLGGKWERSLNEVVNKVKSKYAPKPKQFSLHIDKIGLPENPVNYGDNVVMNITITNDSDYILLKGNPAEPVMTLVGGNTSKFSLNGTWLGLSQTAIMPEAAFLRPKESKTFQVRLFAPLYFGVQREKFVLTDTLGVKYSNTDFEVALNTIHPDKRVIEVKQTPVRGLNVHDNPWSNAAIISKVSTGQRFIVLQETNQGWLNLDLGDGKTGWIVNTYAQTV